MEFFLEELNRALAQPGIGVTEKNCEYD